jgi:hypothetical protein
MNDVERLKGFAMRQVSLLQSLDQAQRQPVSRCDTKVQRASACYDMKASDTCCEPLNPRTVNVMSIPITDLLRSSVRPCRSTGVSFADTPGRGAGCAVRPAVDPRRCARRHTAARCGGVRVRTVCGVVVASVNAVLQHCSRSGRDQHSGRAEYYEHDAHAPGQQRRLPGRPLQVIIVLLWVALSDVVCPRIILLPINSPTARPERYFDFSL